MECEEDSEEDPYQANAFDSQESLVNARRNWWMRLLMELQNSNDFDQSISKSNNAEDDWV